MVTDITINNINGKVTSEHLGKAADRTVKRPNGASETWEDTSVRAAVNRLVCGARFQSRRLSLIAAIATVLTMPTVFQSVSFGQDYGASDIDKLRKRISVSWSDVQLGDALIRLSSNQQLSIFLDRRIDPNQKLIFKAERTPVGEVLYQVADATGCGICWLGDVAYFGPVDKVAEMIVLRDSLILRIQSLPTARKRQLMSSAPMEWPRLSQPGKILATELQELRVETSQEFLPHDLWIDHQFSSIRAIDRVILLSFGFEQWPRIVDDRLIGLGDVPTATDSPLRFRVGKTERTGTMDRLRQDFPDLKVRSEGKVIVVEGEPDLLYQVKRQMARNFYMKGQKKGREELDRLWFPGGSRGPWKQHCERLPMRCLWN